MSAMISKTGSGASFGRGFMKEILRCCRLQSRRRKFPYNILSCDTAVRTWQVARRICMRKITQTDWMPPEVFIPKISVAETDHGVTARDDDPARLQATLEARSVYLFSDDLFHDRGVPM